MQSLKSRGYVREQFAWRHFYWSLTDEGIEYLRDYLHLPTEVVPNTLKRALPAPSRPGRPAPVVVPVPARVGFHAGGDRNSYRREGGAGRGFGGDKKVGPGGGEFKPEFRGGYGRGGQ